MKKHSAKKANGFTLVELIIVIVILAILSVVAIPRFLNANNNAKQNTLEQIMAQLQATVDLNHNLAVVKSKTTGEQTIELEQIGNFSFLGGYPQHKSEASSPNRYFLELMNITLSAVNVVENNNTQRKISYGDLASFETDSLTRIGYGEDEIDDGNCYAEYRLNATNQPEFELVTSGC